MDEILITLEEGAFFSWGKRERVSLTGPIILTTHCRVHSSSGVSSKGLCETTPALFISTSREPPFKLFIVRTLNCEALSCHRDKGLWTGKCGSRVFILISVKFSGAPYSTTTSSSEILLSRIMVQIFDVTRY